LVPRVAPWRYSRGRRTLSIAPCRVVADSTKPTFISNLSLKTATAALTEQGALSHDEEGAEVNDSENEMADLFACRYYQSLAIIIEILLAGLKV
jgi:hypothetical protein